MNTTTPVKKNALAIYEKLTFEGAQSTCFGVRETACLKRHAWGENKLLVSVYDEGKHGGWRELSEGHYLTSAELTVEDMQANDWLVVH